MKEITIEQATECLNQLRIKNLGIKPPGLGYYLNELKKVITEKNHFIKLQMYQQATECRDKEREIIEIIHGDNLLSNILLIYPNLFRNIVLEEILNS
jgi:hypothetical protein